MYISDVFPLVSSPSTFSRRRRVSAVALAIAVALALLIAIVIATASSGSASTSGATLPQQRDLAPSATFRDPQTHALMWVTPGSASQSAASSTPPATRPHYPGK
jgi:hypothetical protein